MKLYKLAALLIILIPLSISSAPADMEPRWQTAFDYAKENLPKEGQLLVIERNKILKVDENYQNALFPLLGVQNEGYLKADSYLGTHIYLWDLYYKKVDIETSDIGKTFAFELKTIKTESDPSDRKIILLQVESKELQEFLKKYGIEQNYAFVIPIAVKPGRLHPH